MAFINTDWHDELYDDYDSSIGISSAMKESIRDAEFEQEKGQMEKPKTNLDIIHEMEVTK